MNMHLNLHTLLHLPVITESGARLGKVSDVTVDAETHTIVGYSVRPHWLTPPRYFIKPNQIKSINRERMVVANSLLTEREPQAAPSSPGALARVFGSAVPRSE